MKCPACGRSLPPGGGACSACGALAGLPVEGALAPAPATLREPSGKRRRERHWKDEVRERMERRRQRDTPGPGPAAGPGAPSELPLFRESAPRASAEDRAPARERAVFVPPASEASGLLSVGPTELGAECETAASALVDAEADDELSLRSPGEREAFLEPLPLHGPESAAPGPEPARPARSLLDEDSQPIRTGDEWTLGEAHGPQPAALVDRPARALERLQAALVDLGVLAALWSGVLYFAGRAARVQVSGLQPAWPWLLGYMTLLGLLYAAYFTGTTGQTLGKMLFGLRVVGRTGRGPSYPAALGRAALGTLGAAAAGLGLVPMVFDPARRALHDRLFGTRVVRPAPPTARLS